MDPHDASKSSLSYQRRTQSVDEYALRNLSEEVFETDGQDTKRTLTNGSDCTVKDCGNGYKCAALPRTNNRPSARTCWRSRSAFAPSPKCNFGPKGTLKKVQGKDHLIIIQDPSSQRLHWISKPNHILIIRKPGPSTLSEFRIICEKLLKRRLNVYIEPDDHARLPLTDDADLREHTDRCIAFDQTQDLSKIDLVVCLGGDGTLLHVASLFQKSCPPVLSFSMGSLGFLTPFDFKTHEKDIKDVLSGNVAVLLRTRLNCSLIKDKGDNSSSSDSPIDDDDATHHALNEIVIDRGPNSYLSNLDLYINGRFITKVQGDGLIISTPTGSTAYAMAAGASMVHPNVPAMVVCPICPHSLSFRPIVVPAGIELTVKVSEDTRLTAWLSVDGRNRVELKQQDSVRITTSVYPVPSICRFDQFGDWFESLAKILHWNLREPQKNDLDTDHDSQHDDQSQNQDDEQSQSQEDEQLQNQDDKKPNDLNTSSFDSLPEV